MTTGTGAALRAAAYAGGTTWIVGEGGTTLILDRGAVAARRLDLGTASPLRAVFARGREVWIVGSDGPRAAVWRVGGAVQTRWGDC